MIPVGKVVNVSIKIGNTYFAKVVSWHIKEIPLHAEILDLAQIDSFGLENEIGRDLVCPHEILMSVTNHGRKKIISVYEVLWRA